MKRTPIKTLVLTGLISFSFINAQSGGSLTFSEVMFIPSELNGEFIEIYNSSETEIVDLSKLKFKYYTSTADNIIEFIGGRFLLPNKYAIIIEGDYDYANGAYKNLIPQDALVLKIGDNSFGTNGMANSSSREIYLLNSSNEVIETYIYSADNLSGISDEKYLLNKDNNSANWRNSLALNGTPGKINSITPTITNDDLSIQIIGIDPPLPAENEIIKAQILIKNLGTQKAINFKIEVYINSNHDGEPQPEENIFERIIDQLGWGDSLLVEVEFAGSAIGENKLFAKVIFHQDENQSNNISTFTFAVTEKNAGYNEVVINEIMYAPASSEPEWIEIYNRSDRVINLKNWRIGDSNQLIEISNEDFQIYPYEYLVISDDQTISSYHHIKSKLLIKTLPTLNNSGDEIILMSNKNKTIDSVKYLSSWGGAEGKSLERRSAGEQSNSEINWATSIAILNSTPGEINSITKRDYDLGIMLVKVEPEKPIVGEEFIISVLVKNLGHQNTNNFSLKIFNDANRDSIGEQDEQIFIATKTELVVDDSIEYTVKFTIDKIGAFQIIAELLCAEDENQYNNKKTTLIDVADKQVNFNDIIINEIMVAPTNDEPEWIELQNISNRIINIKNWKIGDKSSSVIITTKDLSLSPKEFVIICGDSSLLSIHSLTSNFVLKSMPTFNNSGDDVVIQSSTGFIVDSLRYEGHWITSAGGRSLERYSATEPTIIRSNWRFSESNTKSTPGNINSISKRDYDLTISSVTVAPNKLFVYEELHIKINVKNVGYRNSTDYTLQLFNDLNKDSIAELNERIYSSTLNSLENNDSTDFIIPYTFIDSGSYQLIINLIYAEDQKKSNNNLTITLYVHNKPEAFNSIIINEVMFAPINDEPEWIELQNNSDRVINLNGWKIGDNTSFVIITSKDILVQPSEYFLICADSSVLYYHAITSALLVSSMPSLNNNGDDVIIKERTGITIDSLRYDATWASKPVGRSLERISSLGQTIKIDNWRFSEASKKSTPGEINSVTTRKRDLSIEIKEVTPKHPIVDEILTISVSIKNVGLILSDQFVVELYIENFENTLNEKRDLIHYAKYDPLSISDSSNISINYKVQTEGTKNIIALLKYAEDENLLNNESIFNFTVNEKQVSYNEIIINEVMIAPINDEPEWVELKNVSSKNINLKNWKIGDNASSVILDTNDLFLEPNEYLVVSNDSSLLNYYSISARTIVRPMPAFNNNGDEVVIKNLIGNTIDSLKYSMSWVTTPNGRSIERVALKESTTNQLNWRYSEARLKGTPGKTNSVSQKKYDASILNLNSPQKYAVLNSGLNLNVEIKNIGEDEIALVIVNLFHDKSEDGIAQHNEILHQISFQNFLSGEIKIIEFSVSNFNKGKNKFIVEVNCSNDEFTDNNSASFNINGVTINEIRGDLIINEVMYAPSAPESEWIEIFNNSEKVINLNGYKVANSKDTILIANKNVELLSNEILLIAKDTAGFKKYLEIPRLYLSPFPTLMNTKDKIILLDSLDRIIDSLEYRSTWGGAGGKSLEKIEPGLSSPDSTNWRTTVSSVGGTPGYPNSFSRKNFDVEVLRIFYSPEMPGVAQEVKINTQIFNRGKQIALFKLQLNSLLSDGVIENRENTVTQMLHPGDSLLFEFNYTITSLMTKQTFEVNALWDIDENMQNNKMLSSLYPTYNFNTVLINEIMYNPINGEPEWIELYNNSNYPIFLDGWSVLDVLPKSSISKIQNDNYLLPSNKYLIIAKDSTIKNYHRSINSKLIVSNIPNLNNDVDGIVIKDFYNRTIDSVKYDGKWGGVGGKSLERIYHKKPTSDNKNWGSSIDIEYSTPGRTNSLTPKEFDLTVASISSTPSYPIYGENIKLAALVKNVGLSTADNYSVIFYRIENNDTLFLSSEKGVTLTSNDSIMVYSQFEMNIVQPILVLCKVLFQNDEEMFNNYLIAEIKPGAGKYSVLISEVMYDPLKGETEWIEIFNASSENVNLKDWSISDLLPSPTIVKVTSKDVFLLPGEYAVIAADTASYQYLPPEKFFQAKFGALGNSNDVILIYDLRGAVIDSLNYSSWWGGLKGRSLERITFTQSTNDSTNWASSIEDDFATPGFSNSINNLPYYGYGSIIINEIMYEPKISNTEFIEFYNNSSDSIQIGGMRLIIGTNTYHKILESSFKLSPKEFLVLVSDSSIFSNYSRIKENQSIVISKTKFSLSNNGNQLVIKDLKGRTLDSVYYNPTWHNKNIISTTNRSLERLNPGLSSNNPSNWSSSVHIEGASPAYQNSIYSENSVYEAKVTVKPNPFSPDNDGFEDFAIINFDLSNPFSQVRIKVFDSRGRLVRTISENNLAASRNSVIFNGLDDNGNPLRIGIYILLIESVSANNGALDVVKIPIVIARKL
jgi:hypothetical protein